MYSARAHTHAHTHTRTQARICGGGAQIGRHQSSASSANQSSASSAFQKRASAIWPSARRRTCCWAMTRKRNAVEILPLGAGQEVGRSCIIVRYKYAKLLLRWSNTQTHAENRPHVKQMKTNTHAGGEVAYSVSIDDLSSCMAQSEDGHAGLRYSSRQIRIVLTPVPGRRRPFSCQGGTDNTLSPGSLRSSSVFARSYKFQGQSLQFTNRSHTVI